MKLVNSLEELKEQAENLMGKTITHQTGKKEKKLKTLHEEASEISKEFYLSCVVDRSSSKIAFIIVQQAEWILKK